MFSNIKADMKRYEDLGGWFFHPGFWITLIYRYGHWARNLRPKVLGFPFRVLGLLFTYPTRAISHVYLPNKATIGPGLKLTHPFVILIAPGVVVGSNCSIYHEVTIGQGSSPDNPTTLGDGVVVFPGAKIQGGTRIGDHAEISPNTVVAKNVEARAVLQSVPARAIPMQMRETLLKQRAGEE